MAKRKFRTADSIETEARTRNMLPTYLEERGFTNVRDQRRGNAQAIDARSPWGDILRMSIRLCWRRVEGAENAELAQTYSAAQLLADAGGDWEGSLERKFARERSRGITHVLFVQSEKEKIINAALVPVSDVLPIWIKQRDTSSGLIAAGQLGRRRKNHAMNGASPTLWLQDDRGGQDVANDLWNYPGVRNLSDISVGMLPAAEGNRIPEYEPSNFIPREGDRRSVIQRQIKERRGQQAFRDALRKRFNERCVITGCELLDILEAAHIKPYRGSEDNHPENGLLLRADIHTLFDLNLLGIEPNELVIELHSSVAADSAYASLKGTRLRCGPDERPSKAVLEARYAEFRGRLSAGT